ncbi:MAG: subtype I-C CRISPR-associated endonuclease Cas1 [Candidatus Zixiibacteriota bacterium]|nr:MAG: subtype I-C CRISPR-associated endonuclease Cas1 [candidate division Zixibacteria bacterium]
MKKLLNTLYVTTHGAYLSKERETVKISIEHETKLRVPIHNLENIICFGNVSCSPFLMGFCAKNNVQISFLTEYGKFLARIQGPISGNVMLRREQYRKADNENFSADFARSIVIAKINNSRAVILRTAREKPELNQTLKKTASKMLKLLKELKEPIKLDSVRGVEGMAAKEYFNVFDLLIVNQKDDFFFHKRSRRPPLDKMNALISFLYTILMHDISSALEAVGLDPAVGYLHRDRSGRPGLALDLMEELRPYIADRLALTLVNRNQIKGKDFINSESNAIVMSEKGRKLLLTTYQKRKQDEIMHPFLNEKISVGLLPHAQTLLMARFLRGDIDAYPPFVIK